MADQIEITPEDLASFINRESLTTYLSGLILDIRNSDSTKYSILKQKINQLSKYNNDNISKSSTIEELKDAYDTVKIISIEIRKLLSEVFPQIEAYDNINYAIYYKGKRYYADQLKTKWLRKSGTRGDLQLQISQMAKELQEFYDSIGLSKLQEAFELHLMSYQSVIKGTYRGVIGRGGALNEGHITEAFESHIAEHHTAAYQLFNSMSILSSVDKVVAASEFEKAAKTVPSGNWTSHEDITEAWIHIRNSFGVQKGTAAGDVRDAQVKAIKKAEQGKQQDSKIRLERFNVIKTGISTYCAILDKGVPANEVAESVIKYIEEPLRNISSKVISNATNEDAQNMLIKSQEIITQLKPLNVFRG